MTVTLQDAINVIQAGDMEKGRALLVQVLKQDPNNEAAWIWMSGTVDDLEQRRQCLERALAINPENLAAKAGLARLGIQPPDAIPPTPLARQDHGLGQPSASEQPKELPAAPAVTPAFVWPEKGEPEEESSIVEETFIGDIVAAMNKEEETAPPAQDTDLNWVLQSPDQRDAPPQGSEQELRDLYIGPEEQPSGKTAGEAPTARQATQESDFVQAGEEAERTPEPGFTGLEPDEVAALTAVHIPGQLWCDPNHRSRRVTILTNLYLIGASINLKHLAEIEEMLKSGQTSRRLLGGGARFISLGSISSVQAHPDSPTLLVNYERNKRKQQVLFTLASIAQRDEVVESFKTRLGERFTASIRKPNLLDVLFSHILTLVLLLAFTGSAYWLAVVAYNDTTRLPGWLPEPVVTWLAGNITEYSALWVVGVGACLIALVMLWMVSTWRKAGRILVLERETIEPKPS